MNDAFDNLYEEYNDEDGEYQEDDEQNTVRTLMSRITQLESELVKAKATNAVKRTTSPGIQQMPSTQSEQIEQLLQQNQDLQATIQILSSGNLEDLQRKNSENLTSSLNAQLVDLQEKLQAISEENIRLNDQLGNQKQRFESTDKSQEYYAAESTQAIQAQIEESISKAENLLHENKLLQQMNDKLTFNYNQLDDNYRKLQLSQSEKTEELRVFWKDHFQKLQESMQLRFETEKKELLSQIERKNQQTSSYQTQLIANQGQFVERAQMQAQIDTQTMFSKKMEVQIKEYQLTIENNREEIFEKQKKILEIESQLVSLTENNLDLSNTNQTLQESLKKLENIESKTHEVINENIRLQEIAERKSEQTHLKSKLLDAERISKDSLIQELKKEFEHKISIFQENSKHERETWLQAKQELFNSLSETHNEKLALQASLDNQNSEISALNHRKQDLENKLAQLLEKNRILNESLEERLSEIEIWKEKNALSNDEIALLHRQYKQEIEELEIKQKSENKTQKESYDANISEVQHKMSALAAQFNRIERKKSDDERALLADFNHKIEVEKQRYIIVSEQTTLLKSAISNLESNHQKLLDQYNRLQKQHDIKASIIHQLEDDLRNSRQETAAALLQIDILSNTINENQHEFDELKRTHHNHMKQSPPPYTFLSNYEDNAYGQGSHQESNIASRLNNSEPRDKENILRSNIDYFSGRARSPFEQVGTSFVHAQRTPASTVKTNTALYEKNRSRSDFEEAQALRAAVESLRIENKNLLLAKVNDYNNYQENLRKLQGEKDQNNNNNNIQQRQSEQNQVPSQLKNPFRDTAQFSNTGIERQGVSPHVLSSSIRPNSQLRPQSRDNKSDSIQTSSKVPSKLVAYDNTSNSSNYDSLLRDLEYHKSKEQSQIKLMETLKQENQKISNQYKDLEKKYISQNDWILDQCEAKLEEDKSAQQSFYPQRSKQASNNHRPNQFMQQIQNDRNPNYKQNEEEEEQDGQYENEGGYNNQIGKQGRQIHGDFYNPSSKDHNYEVQQNSNYNNDEEYDNNDVEEEEIDN